MGTPIAIAPTKPITMRKQLIRTSLTSVCPPYPLWTISTKACHTATGEGSANAGKIPAIDIACQSTTDITSTAVVNQYEFHFPRTRRILITGSIVESAGCFIVFASLGKALTATSSS
ncbi:hypothetical protein [Paraburkholderia diazotrophica]|uniref:hypothetical protein n=1 Tax=Paraburkholderia diazotrophica TaxID=667676 RepID=UPI00316EFEEC